MEKKPKEKKKTDRLYLCLVCGKELGSLKEFKEHTEGCLTSRRIQKLKDKDETYRV